MQAQFAGSYGTATSVTFTAEDEIVVERSQDVGLILDTTKELHNSGCTGGKDLKFAGSFPRVVVEAYCTRNQIKFSEFMQMEQHQKALLNDKSLEHFRIWKGRV